MGQYISKYATIADYEAAVASGLDKPHTALVKETMAVYFHEYEPPKNIIKYNANAKLTETTSQYSYGFHTNSFSGKNGQLTITSHTFENGVGTVEFNADVTSIGDSAFWGCDLTSIEIPNSVTSIGYRAFQDCRVLTSIEIPNGVTSIGVQAFASCYGLTSIEIPNSVTSIGNNAFSSCTSLTSVTIGNGVTSIGQKTFYYCTFLTSISIPSSVTSIAADTFQGCSGLISIIVDANNQTYDSRDNCNAIIETSTNTLILGCKNTVIPNTVTSIGNSAFFECSGLTSITIPSSVTSIGTYAFSNCSGLTSITMSNSVTSIGTYAFSYCSGLTSITIPNTVTSIGAYAFSYCSGLTSISIPNSVTSIGDNAFQHCSVLTSVTLNSNSIASKTYTNQKSLKSIFGNYVKTYIIGNDVTSIGAYAFFKCSALTSITIPSSVTSIGDVVFWGCSGLTSIVCNATTAPTIQTYTFQNVKTDGTLTVPIGSSGYDVWMQNTGDYLGSYGWTKVEQ